MKKLLATGLLALATGGLINGCMPAGTKAPGQAGVAGVVTDGSTHHKLAAASVWMIPAADVAALGKTALVVKKDSANDEPLEDSLAANRSRYPKAVTNAQGEFAFAQLPEGRYFVYVEPADRTYLPGGDKARKAMSVAELSAARLEIQMSGNTPAGATYVGTSKCLSCHEDQEGFTGTLHRLGITVVGKPGKLQNHARFPDFNKGLDKLLAGTQFWFHGYDKARGFDKYQISTKAPADASSVSFTATFYKDAGGKLMFRTENAKDPKDPPRVYPVELTYGGGLYKQRYVYRVGRNLFPFVQFNQLGDDAYADRGRKVWRDYHADWLFNETTGKLSDPAPAKAFDKECAACHYNGYTLTKDAAGNYIAGAASDPAGELDIDGDGKPNEINLGCETCHGPGSVHADGPKSTRAATIVSPKKLAAEREAMICGQCHSRPQGHLKNDEPVNAAYRMMPPGTARNVFLNEYTTREDAAAKDYWPDGLHSKSHHQQYTDFIKSAKYRNGNRLVGCADCHDTHASKFPHQMRFDSRKAESCTGCHADRTDLRQHLADKTKCTVAPEQITCADCHNTKTMQTGAGLGRGLAGKEGKNYWLNDITSHLYDVPRKDNKGVKGVEAGKAMPIPYTQPCGKACHDTSKL